jgi:hypothetical protein
MNNPRRYEDDIFTEVGSKMSEENVERMGNTDRNRAKLLSTLVKHKKLQLGGRTNKNKKKHRKLSRRRTYSKKNRRFMKRK